MTSVPERQARRETPQMALDAFDLDNPAVARLAAALIAVARGLPPGWPSVDHTEQVAKPEPAPKPKRTRRTFSARSVYGATTRRSLVAVTLGDDTVLVTPAKAKEMAACLLKVATAAQAGADLTRAVNAPAGEPARIGRPPLTETGEWRPIAARIEQIRAEQPTLPWWVIAGLVGVDESTLRKYRRLLRRESAELGRISPATIR